jgi:hypothetical protein
MRPSARMYIQKLPSAKDIWVFTFLPWIWPNNISNWFGKKLTVFAHTIKYVIVTYKSNIPLFEEKESIHGETLVEAQLLDQQ